MRRIIITHVGTSVLKCDAISKPRQPPSGYSQTESLPRSNVPSAYDGDCSRIEKAEWNTQVAAKGEAQPIVKELIGKWEQHLEVGLRYTWNDPNTKKKAGEQRRPSPAEIASLSLLRPTAEDRIVLLHSETVDGEFCARLLESAIKTNLAPDSDYPYCADVVRRIVKGLRVSDSAGGSSAGGSTNTFVRQGLVSYIEEVWTQYTLLRNSGGRELVFNVTGGYKGMIPVGRDLSLLLFAHSRSVHLGITSRLVYLYSSSSELVDYAALPVVFDWDAVGEIQELLRLASAEGKLEKADITDDDKVYFEDNPEREGYYRLSALGEVIRALYPKIDTGNVNVSTPI